MPVSRITTDISTILDAKIQEFMEKIAKDKNIELQDLRDVWNNVSLKKKIKKNKMNCYLIFQRDIRSSVKTANPSLSFGDVSREIGRRWQCLSEKAKQQYRKRANIFNKYHSHELWEYYKNYPTEKLYHIAQNWLEDEPSVSLSVDASKEEILELLILHSEVKEVPKTDEHLSLAHEIYLKYSQLTYKDILKEIKKEYPSFSDGAYTNKDDLISFLIEQKTRVEEIPLEVHPYYYTLVSKSLDALKKLCQETIPGFHSNGNQEDRRKLIELLIRNFDKISLENEV